MAEVKVEDCKDKECKDKECKDKECKDKECKDKECKDKECKDKECKRKELEEKLENMRKAGCKVAENLKDMTMEQLEKECECATQEMRTRANPMNLLSNILGMMNNQGCQTNTISDMLKNVANAMGSGVKVDSSCNNNNNCSPNEPCNTPVNSCPVTCDSSSSFMNEDMMKMLAPIVTSMVKGLFEYMAKSRSSSPSGSNEIKPQLTILHVVKFA